MPDQERRFRQLSLGETLGKTLQIFFSRLDVFLILSLGVIVPMSLTTVLFVASLYDRVKSNDELWDFFVNDLGFCMSYILFQTMLYVILFFTVQAALVRAAAEIYAGKSPQWPACFCHGFHKFGSLVCARLLVWFFLVSTLALVVALSAALVQSHWNGDTTLVAMLIIAYTAIAFTVWMTTMILYPVIVVEEGTGPTVALRRSFALSRGMRCYFFCSALCLWTTKLFVLGVLHGIFATTSQLSSLVSIAGVIATAVTSLFSLPLTTILSTVMYMSARARFDHFTRYELLGNLQIEDDDNNQGSGVRDERQVPLLSDTDLEAEAVWSPPLVENVLVVDEKEVPADMPEATEVV